MCLKEVHCFLQISLAISESGKDFLEYAGNAGQSEHCQIGKLRVLEYGSAPIKRKPLCKKYIKILSREDLRGEI